MDALPFANGSFDAVAATGVLEYAESAPDAVNELARVLRPGGLAVLSIPNRYSWHGFSRRVSDPVARSVKHACLGVQSTKARHDRLPSPRGFVRLLAERGLRVREVRYSGALLIPAPIDRLVPTASERLGLTFERRARLRSVLATQFVVSAIKAHAAPASGNGEAP
jgi:SAM-dependent methyltransferase